MIGMMAPNVFAAEPYVSGSIVTSDDYLPWDRYIDVNGLRILGVSENTLGTDNVSVSDEFMEKIARTVQLLLDPDAPGIDSDAQITAINGMANNCSNDKGFPQGVDSNQFGPTLQRTFADRSPPVIFYSWIEDVEKEIYPSWYESASDLDQIGIEFRNDANPRWTDFVFQYTSGVQKNGQVTEVIEHLLHTFSHFAFPVAYPVDLNIQTPDGPLWEAMQEAIRNGVFNISQYKEADDGSNEYYALLMQEYSYLLIYAEWNYIPKYVDGQSLAPEWADNSRTSVGVERHNPLGHALYQNYLSKIVSQPNDVILDTMFAINGASGYIATSTGRENITPVDCTAENSSLKNVETTQETVSDSTGIPPWIKNNAGWWADGIIDDSSFIQGIQFLIKEGIIVIEQEQSETEFQNTAESAIATTFEPPDMIISTPPKLEEHFSKYIEIFGVPIYATSHVTDAKLLHAANVLAQYLDNDEDGVPDNLLVLNAIHSHDGAMTMHQTEWEYEHSDWPSMEDLTEYNYYTELWSSETYPIGEFDASLEEILHLVTQAGYANAYPEIFGLNSSLITTYMDNARGGHFEEVPKSQHGIITYPRIAWYTAADETCDYECMTNEYFYWGLTTILGAQQYRWEAISSEWELQYKEQVMQTDPDLYYLLTDPQYKLPTVLPDGNYSPIQ